MQFRMNSFHYTAHRDTRPALDLFNVSYLENVPPLFLLSLDPHGVRHQAGPRRDVREAHDTDPSGP